MKTTLTSALFLLAGLSGPALAETSSTAAKACLQPGPPSVASEDCKAMRIAFRAEVSDCIARMKAQADTAKGLSQHNAPQSTRARLFLCDAKIRQKLGLADQ